MFGYGDDWMKHVNPILDEDADYKVSQALRRKHPRYELLWLMGTRCGLRISDLLTMTVADSRLDSWAVTEKKTGKVRCISFPPEVREAIISHIARYHLKESDYLIYSRTTRHDAQLGREYADTVIRKAGQSVGIPGLGSHSMRKSFAVRYIQSGGDIEALQAILNHKYLSTTLGYLLVREGGKARLVGGVA